MPRHPVPTGAERQALFDELSAIFARCGEQAAAIDRERDAAIAAIPGAQLLLARRDAVVHEAQRKADVAEEKAERAAADAVQAADREFYDAAQAADARRMEVAIDADRDRDLAVHDAQVVFEGTISAIHNATAGLQSVADAELRARLDRDRAVQKAELACRDAIRKAEADRNDSLEAATNRQVAAHAAADDARSRAFGDAQLALVESIRTADRVLDDGLRALPGAARILDDALERRAALEQASAEQKRAVEARLRGDE